jgi:hypothetical protein
MLVIGIMVVVIMKLKKKRKILQGGMEMIPNVVIAEDTAYIKPRTWYKIAYTYDGQVAKFYVDGILRNSETISTTFTSNSDDLFFGKLNYLNYYYWFNGIIDEIRIYNKALTAHQIKIYHNNRLRLDHEGEDSNTHY